MVPFELSSLFLSKTQLDKLFILKQLESGMTTFSSLEMKLKISKRKIKEIVLSLIKEMNVIRSDQRNELSVDREIIQFKLKLKDNEYVELINDFRVKYLLESSLYRVLLFVLEKRTFSIVIMANDLSYSESYTYKLFGKLKQFFKHMNYGIQLKKENAFFFKLDGNESTIRILHYLAVSVASKGNQWLFTSISQNEIMNTQFYIDSHRYKRLSPVGKNRVNSILAVYELALKNKYKITNLNTEVSELGNAINREIEINLYLKYLKEEVVNNDTQLQEEIIHLAFLINYFSQEVRTDDEKEILGKHILSLTNNSIAKNCDNILKLINRRYELSEETNNILLYSLCNRFVVIYYLGLYKFMPLYNVPPLLGDKECFIGKCIDNSLTDYKHDASYEKVKYSFTQVISGYLNLELSLSQKIYVEFFHRPEYKSIIENAIKHNYNQKVLQITNNYLEADIVISDTHGYDKKKFFYFRDVFDQGSWGKLGLYLNQVIRDEILETN
ncbi:helix-turn-helix domain-containing protein [Listeria monocytogenes]|nr:helix-turn-helix domain-containing protein [Listeria monocytogenes]HCY9426298.1 helix-turn-helix domain-containing protein [Listeria monocytogenes]